MKPPRTTENPAKPILFSKYPELKKKIPWITLGAFPTPIRHLERLGAVESLVAAAVEHSAPAAMHIPPRTDAAIVL